MTLNRNNWTEKKTPIANAGEGVPVGARVWGASNGWESAFVYLTPGGEVGGNVTGLCSVGCDDLDKVAARAELEMEANKAFRARQPIGSWGDADRRMTRKQVAAFLDD